MRRAHRPPKRLIRLTSLCACLALVLTSLAMVPPLPVSGRVTLPSAQDQDNQGPKNDKARKVKAEPPQKGAPSATLPNLDEVKGRREPDPEAPAALPSTMRSKHRPLESRKGKRVGDPGTTGDRVGSILDRTGSGSDRILSARSHHARIKARATAPPPLADDQFIQNFFYWAFLRYPNSTEQAYWNDILRTAYPQGQSAMLIAMRELGMTVFESAEYAARNRSNHDYVYDLYKTFLMRDPDSGGWANWESSVPTMGRENVRHGFEYSTEFANLVATLTPNGSASSNAASLVTARVDPNNQTGNQMLARDCEWSVGLLNLPGRAGLDLGLGLSYSSLVWTRSGPYLYFDEDNGSPSPGFRLGFATIQGGFDAQVGRKVYVLITSSGHRIELRQVGTSNVYEAGDSSYLQLIDNGSLLVRTTDGTQMDYVWFENEWRATQIKDRNGNYLTVNYDSHANITNITDTLGRVITFNYDTNANPLSITQSWNGTTHTWATFGWGTLNLQPGFSNVSLVGTYTGETIPVLTQVGLGDGSFFTFQYTGAGQVNLIRRYSSDYVQRSYTAYDYAAATSDCPRISQTRVWAENWTGVNGVPTEVVTQYNEPGDGSHQVTAPDGTVYKESYGTGWQKGLTTQSEVWSGGVRQKWTTAAWTQDNTGVSYQTNPRVTETNIYDSSGNRRRTTVGYQTFSLPSGASCSLPNDISDFSADAATVLRRTQTYFETSATYLDRRIIGLPWLQTVSNDAGNLVSKRDFHYDWGGGYMVNQGAPVQYDGANYGSGFLAGRGNLVVIRQFDVTDPNNNSLTHDTRIGYNTTGSVIFKGDGSWHTTSVTYTDSFSDSVNHNTLSYPTTVTDPDGFSSTLQYNYDFGAQTRAQGPPPAGQSQGVIQTIAYDSAARVDRVTTLNTGAYTRYIYGTYYVQSWSSVNNPTDEAYSIQTFDGAGRVIGAARNHPGSAGGYSAVNTQYDLMGRVMKQSNPTEINVSWVPVGDDAAGLLYTQQTYDWKGRPLVTTNTDGTQKYASYGGCGCAGGEVVTLTDEVGRQQKVYSDVLGRTAKTEVLNWDSTVYSTTANSFNARDQVTLVRQYQGADTSGTYQDTSITYDGYGRLLTKHAPEQNAGTATVYAYNSDDTVQSVIDARGASATYSYNNRHLATGISYSAPAGITPTSNVSLVYDAAGNRTSMSDGFGSKTYTYNQLSQLMSEARIFNGVGTFTLSYDYNLAGQLKKITDPTNVTINYGFDSTGRLSGVTGSDTLYAGVSTYASNFQYRAWGGAKHLNYGNSLTVDLGYNNRLQATQYDLKTAGGTEVFGLQYRYTSTPTSTDNDGRLKYSHDLVNSNLDRTYSYDQAARLALGDTANGSYYGPYKQTYGYDAWGNLTNRSWRTFYYNQYCHCMAPQTNYSSSNYSNNRNTATGWNYDADGRLLGSTDGGANFTYGFDAAGQLISNTAPGKTLSQSLDGDGLKAKWVENGVTTYYVRSSALGGQTMVELDQYGNKVRGYVYGGGQEIAKQEAGQVLWDQRDVSGVSMRLTSSSGGVASKVETDPLGTQVSDSSAFNYSGGTGYGFNPNGFYGDPTMPNMGCSYDDVPTPCSIAAHAAEAERSVGRTPNVVFGNSWDLNNLHLTIGEIGNLRTIDFGFGNGEPARSMGYTWIPYLAKGDHIPAQGEYARNRNHATYPQNSGETIQEDPCAKFLPLNIPEGVSVDANMAKAKQMHSDLLHYSHLNSGDPVSGQMTFDLWFYDQVKDKGPWDYKYRTPDHMLYDPFGNFNYGATGSAGGYTLDTLYRVAGWIQQHRSGPEAASVGRGVPSRTLAEAYLGTGGEYPYGDKPDDSTYIKMGYDYAKCRGLVK